MDIYSLGRLLCNVDAGFLSKESVMVPSEAHCTFNAHSCFVSPLRDLQKYQKEKKATPDVAIEDAPPTEAITQTVAEHFEAEVFI